MVVWVERAVDAQGAFALAAQDLDPVALLGVAKGIEVAEDVGDRASVPRRASPILGPCGGFRFGEPARPPCIPGTVLPWCHHPRAQRGSGAWWVIAGVCTMLRVKLEEVCGV